jgi:hypothetical protein
MALNFFSANLHAQSAGEKGLKDYYQNYFPIGVTVSQQSIKNKNFK